MKILFLVLYPVSAPSPRYRVYQLVPYLQNQGLECEVQSLLTEDEFRASRSPGSPLKKASMLGRALWRRVRYLRSSLKKFDAVYILKGTFPYGAPWFERWIRKSGVKMIFDFDDAIHIHKPSTHHRWADSLKSTKRVPEIIKMVDGVIVPNDYLATYSRQFNHNVSVVHEAEDTDRFVPRGPHKNDEQLSIGWVGSPSTVKYLRLIEPALAEIAKRFPHVCLKIVGGQFETEAIPTECVPWSLEGEVELFQSLDIGLMPLPLEEWSKGKSGCKLRQYMATGVPGVATRIGYNCELVRHGETGFLVESQQEWIEALSQLIESAELRNRVAQRAREEVVERFSLQRIGPQMVERLQGIVKATP